MQGEDQAYFWLTAWRSAQPQGRNLRHIETRYTEQAGGHSICVDSGGDEITLRLIPLSGNVLLR